MEKVEQTQVRNRRSNRKKLLSEKAEKLDNDDVPSHFTEERQVGDGAPAEISPVEDMCAEKSNSEEETANETEKESGWLRLKLDVDVVCVGLFLLTLFTRLYKLEQPRNIVFDELHYGRYVSLYVKGVFFFDSHPPLGKQLLYLAARAAGYDGNATFDRIGSPYGPSVPVWSLRAVPAVAGSLLAPLAYKLMAVLGASQWSAALAALLILCENSLLVRSRFMLLEPLLLVLSVAGTLCVVTATRQPRGTARVLWLCLAAVLLGCCTSVKYVGFYSYLLGAVLSGAEAWRALGDPRRTSLSVAWSAAWRALTLISLPLAVYVGVFYAHLSVLTRAGPHDSIMTSAFQASLGGGLASITRGQPLHVVHGSQITLRHTRGRMCWLHSHAHVYPVRYTDSRGSSHQQQVTCYSFKDVNNWWIVKRPHKTELAVETPVDKIRHGDVVQLVHGITSRALNSHDVAAPVTPQAQEVSCYIDYNISMAAQNEWRVEIVNRADERATWNAIDSQVRLVHAATGAALRYSGRQLPDWGFHQHEVVGDRAGDHPDTVWNVEEHRYTKTDDRSERSRQLVTAEMIPTRATRLSFLDKFWELQQKLLLAAPDTAHNHMFSSEPHEWPFLTRGIAYWVSSDSNAQVHLIGNLVVWYSGTLAVVVYVALLCWYLLRRHRHIHDLSPRAWTRFTRAGQVLLGGYLVHYLPFFFVERTLFLHHYLPAYIFKILLLVFVIEHAYEVLMMSKRTRVLGRVYLVCVAVWLGYVVRTFEKFTAINYGTVDFTESDLIELRWKDTWDFILHKK